MTDPLTGISNRRRFQQVLEGSFGAAMYVAIVDVDRFRQSTTSSATSPATMR